METIRFEKLSMHDRRGEPVSLAIPFAEGRLSDPDSFGVANEGKPVFCQKQVTGRWPDGSVRWLLIHFLADLLGNREHRMGFAWDGSLGEGNLEAGVSVVEAEGAVEIDTGPLRLLCARDGFDLFREVRLNGKSLGGTCSGFYVADSEGKVYSTGKATCEKVEVVEKGPVRAVVEFAGKHRGDDGELLDFCVRVYAWAGKPWVQVEYQFVSREEIGTVVLKKIGLEICPQIQGSARCAIGEGHYRTGVQEGSGRKLLDQELIRYQAVEHVLETFYGDFWADWCDEEKGVTVSLFQAHQNFPKGVRVEEGGIEAEIFPADQEPVEIRQGVAKTHRLQFFFHDAETSRDEAVVRSLQFQYPDIGTLSEDWYRRSGVWDDLFPRNRCDRLESWIVEMADGRGLGLGMLHWGDGPDYGYTNQGRGKGKIVWTNNEYDLPHAMALYFARTGERRFLDCALVAAQHWIDVDLCHFSEDANRQDGHITHSDDHVTGGVSPSHQWTEGLIDVYHLTGKREFLDAALGIGGNILRRVEQMLASPSGSFAARETGWALRALLGIYRETGDVHYMDVCRQIVDQFVSWQEEWGGFLAPYTSHTKVRVPFMIAIAANALMRYYRLTGEERVEKLIVDEVGDMVDHCVMPEGRFFYKELPSLHRRADNPNQLEAMAHAYALSGDRKFLRQIHRMFQVMLDRGRGSSGRSSDRGGKFVEGDAVIFGGPGPKGFAAAYVPIMEAYRVMAEEGLLEDLDYRGLA